MNLFKSKITYDQTLSLSPIISLQETFEEFYQYIQKNSESKQDIEYQESQDLLYSKIFKENIENSQNQLEIALPRLDLITALKIYQWVFNTNYMNLQIIDIVNDKTHNILRAEIMKKMLDNDFWPEILCFVLSESYKENIVSYIESRLEKSDKEYWDLKSIIASNGFLYISIVKKDDLWVLSKLFSPEKKKLTLSEAIIEALEGGFKPISFFYFYEPKKNHIKHDFLLKNSEKYTNYCRMLSEIPKTKSKCCGEGKIAQAVIKMLKSDEGFELRNAVKSMFLLEKVHSLELNKQKPRPRYLSVEPNVKNSIQKYDKKPQKLSICQGITPKDVNENIINSSNTGPLTTYENLMINSNGVDNMIKTMNFETKNSLDIKTSIWDQAKTRNYAPVPGQSLETHMEETKKYIENYDKNLSSSAKGPKPLNFARNKDSLIDSRAQNENCREGSNIELQLKHAKSNEPIKVPPRIESFSHQQKKLNIPEQTLPPPLPNINIPPKKN
ncbi:hypothetical protein SteCoe_31361 [Stentor coeruleus]|uniref:Uncharacterized protein n=1 Tax=Stentor coeruleus TaxID=5963 RepID=A0A1R2B1G5_9CILI|nr:hypothetical protein SteCoe_31361 [Stentor coeruleus]